MNEGRGVEVSKTLFLLYSRSKMVQGGVEWEEEKKKP